jgi:transcriptional regulator with XRE-family HTH domain
MREQAILKGFGRRVRELRKARGWTQEQLAEAADLHENYISRLETGEQEPGLFTILRLCQALETTPNGLLDAE